MLSLKNDAWIRERVEKTGMLDPFSPTQVREDEAGGKVISYGLSSYGYDLRLAREFQLFTNRQNTTVDPKAFDERSVDLIETDRLVIPPNGFALARSVEYIRMPPNVLGVCMGKSTYARCGLICNVTPLEPGWEGHLTLELTASAPLPTVVYANEGIVQLLFFEGEPCETTYADRGGKYQAQRGITLPRT